MNMTNYKNEKSIFVLVKLLVNTSFSHVLSHAHNNNIHSVSSIPAWTVLCSLMPNMGYKTRQEVEVWNTDIRNIPATAVKLTHTQLT